MFLTCFLCIFYILTKKCQKLNAKFCKSSALVKISIQNLQDVVIPA